jgi:hypothetical protein
MIGEELLKNVWKFGVTAVKAVAACHVMFSYGAFPTQVRAVCDPNFITSLARCIVDSLSTY